MKRHTKGQQTTTTPSCIYIFRPPFSLYPTTRTRIVDELVVQENKCRKKPSRDDEETLFQKVAGAPHSWRMKALHRLIIHAEERPLILHRFARGAECLPRPCRYLARGVGDAWGTVSASADNYSAVSAIRSPPGKSKWRAQQ